MKKQPLLEGEGIMASVDVGHERLIESTACPMAARLANGNREKIYQAVGYHVMHIFSVTLGRNGRQSQAVQTGAIVGCPLKYIARMFGALIIHPGLHYGYGEIGGKHHAKPIDVIFSHIDVARQVEHIVRKQRASVETAPRHTDGALTTHGTMAKFGHGNEISCHTR